MTILYLYLAGTFLAAVIAGISHPHTGKDFSVTEMVVECAFWPWAWTVYIAAAIERRRM